MKKFVIIDGNAIIHRAYHALPPLTTKEGLIVNAVYGFTSTLIKILNDFKPDYLAVSFDVAGGSFRDEIFADYKGKRVKADQELYDQIPLVHEVVRTFGVPIFTRQGFEADDIIGTLATRLRTKETGITTIIVTGDMDMLQLVDDAKVEVYLLRKGLSDFVLFDEKKVKEHFSFGPERMIDYKSLRGDTSDNIPGVKGIGEKTAKELIEKIGGIDEIYQQLSEIEGSVISTKPKGRVERSPATLHMQGDSSTPLRSARNDKTNNLSDFRSSVIQKLIEGKDSAYMSQKLATIDCDVKGLEFKLENCVTPLLDTEKLLPMFQKFEFTSLLKRIGPPSLKLRRTRADSKKAIKLSVVDQSNFDNFYNKLKKADSFACKEIISGANVLEGTLTGLVYVIDDIPYFVDLNKFSEKEKIKLMEIFTEKNKILIGHDLKQLVKVLLLNKIELGNELFDVMIASYMMNSSTRAHDIQAIALRELGTEIKDTSAQSSLFGVDPDAIAKSLLAVFEVEKLYRVQLKERSDSGLFQKVEMELIPVLAEVELNGVAVDTEKLAELSKYAAETVKKLTEKIWKEAGEEFNVSSPVQLRDILYEKMGLRLPGIKKGKTGYSTAASELEKLRGVHPIIEFIEEYREVTKLQNTYIDVLPTLINKKTHRIHTTFNQAVTTTGRLSSSEPNLQNIPIRSELGKKIRDAFISEPGNELIAADYSQIELRIVASLAEDEKLIEIFKKGEDVHKATAAAIHNVPLDQVTKEMRYSAKEINFGVLYGMGSYGLSWRAGIPQWQAKDFIEKYFGEFSGVKKYLEQTIQFAKKEGYVETLFGRRRYIPELQSDNFQLRSAGERMAVNMPIQGTAADLMKMAMIQVFKKIKQRFCHSHASGNPENCPRLILQVHDELVLEVKKGLESEVSEIVKKEMEHVAKLRVPIDVHVNAGKRWGEIK